MCALHLIRTKIIHFNWRRIWPAPQITVLLLIKLICLDILSMPILIVSRTIPVENIPVQMNIHGVAFSANGSQPLKNNHLETPLHQKAILAVIKGFLFRIYLQVTCDYWERRSNFENVHILCDIAKFVNFQEIWETLFSLKCPQ